MEKTKTGTGKQDAGASPPSAKQTQEDIIARNTEEQVVEKDIDLAKKLEEVNQQYLDNKDKMLRMAAEFENYKKRMDREREVHLRYAEEHILKELLPGIDNLERAMEQGREATKIDSLLDGIELTRKGLLETLEKFGVTPVESEGKPFDPNLHEAIATEESDDMPDNLVLKEFVKGYVYKDRLLRAAKVVVAKGNKSEA